MLTRVTHNMAFIPAGREVDFEEDDFDFGGEESQFSITKAVKIYLLTLQLLYILVATQ